MVFWDIWWNEALVVNEGQWWKENGRQERTDCRKTHSSEDDWKVANTTSHFTPSSPTIPYVVRIFISHQELIETAHELAELGVFFKLLTRLPKIKLGVPLHVPVFLPKRLPRHLK
ncbi:hypothetical protein BSKO_08332 [Bryopsis sp. KO-2023]|nr:hypothetical protein BSKO_08332 [Bryopsis sp. KO-2023]